MDGVFFYFYNSVIIYCCKCGASLPEGAKFCHQCGFELPVVCAVGITPVNSIEDVEDKSPLEVDCKDSDKSSMILMIWIVSLVASELLRWVHNFLPLDYSIRCGVLTGLNIIRYLLFFAGVSN